MSTRNSAPARAATPNGLALFRHQFRCLVALAIVLLPQAILAGGPKFIAGSSYFNPAATGQPVHWAGGHVNYYVDQRPLNASVSNQQATAMVDAAAALWSAVPTAGVTLTDAGSLNEDVSGENIQVNSSSQITAPADVTASAANYPVAVIYDADGSVINAIFGPTASQPNACQTNGVYFWIDNFSPDATFAHGIILLNGLCATSPALVEMMSFQIERAFGRILGLDFSQVNPGALTGGDPYGALGSPVMQPFSGACGSVGGECIPSPATLRYDDIAALNRIYPITSANLSNFPSKQITAPNTISIQGTVSFNSGDAMQGVNAVARPLDSNGNPLYEYTVTAVSGALFSANHGSPVTGFTDSSGNALSMWGSSDASLQGFFDLRGIPLPPGVTSAAYQITFETVDPLDVFSNSVGPYTLRARSHPRARCKPLPLSNLSAGSTRTVTVTAAGSAAPGFNDAIGAESQPRPMPTGGQWVGRLSQVGQTDWFTFPVRGNRIFTVVTQAFDESGSPSAAKAMPSVGSGMRSVLSDLRPRARSAPSMAPPPVRPGSGSRPSAMTWCASASQIFAATGVPISPIAAGSSTRIPSRPHACRPPAAPSRLRGWASAWPTPSSSAASPRRSSASRPTRSLLSRLLLHPASPARSTSKSTISPASTQPPLSLPGSVTTPARAMR